MVIVALKYVYRVDFRSSMGSRNDIVNPIPKQLNTPQKPLDHGLVVKNSENPHILDHLGRVKY